MKDLVRHPNRLHRPRYSRCHTCAGAPPGPAAGRGSTAAASGPRGQRRRRRRWPHVPLSAPGWQPPASCCAEPARPPRQCPGPAPSGPAPNGCATVQCCPGVRMRRKLTTRLLLPHCTALGAAPCTRSSSQSLNKITPPVSRERLA